MTMALGLSDIKAQMAGWCIAVLSPATVSAVWAIRCAICRRLKASGEDGYRSAPRSRADAESGSVQQAWQQWLNKLPPARREDDDVKEIRWMIEELRVSYFAQQLGTPYPVSDKRVQAMEQVSA
jgi:ATP-dependent helicase HrpA